MKSIFCKIFSNNLHSQRSFFYIFTFSLVFLFYSNGIKAQESKRYGAQKFSASIDSTQSSKSSYVIFHLKSKGNSILTSSGFIPLKGQYTIEGEFYSAIELPDDRVKRNFSVDSAVVNGWCYVKQNDEKVNFALKLIGQTIIPLNRQLLELIVNADTKVSSPKEDEIYPEDGRLHVWLVCFNEYGAVVQANKDGGLYVIENRDGFISLADNPNFTVIDATPAVKVEAQKMLNAMK
jgi:hypothetical protein